MVLFMQTIYLIIKIIKITLFNVILLVSFSFYTHADLFKEFIFDGEFEADSRCEEEGNFQNCFGSYEYKNLGKYTGNFKDGKPNGLGLMIYKNGLEMFGEWKNGKKPDDSIIFYQGNTWGLKHKNGKQVGDAKLINKGRPGTKVANKNSNNKNANFKCPYPELIDDGSNKGRIKNQAILASQKLDKLVFEYNRNQVSLRQSINKEALTLAKCLAYRSDRVDYNGGDSPINNAKLAYAVIIALKKFGLDDDNKSKNLFNEVINSKKSNDTARQLAKFYLDYFHPSKQVLKQREEEKKIREYQESDEFKLQEEYEFYFIVRKCHEVNPLYISSNELKKAKKKIRATDNFYKSKGVDTNAIYKKAETNPQEHIRKILGSLELGGIGGYQQGFASTCKLYFTGMKKVEGPKGKKDF